jgi:hypothetical protein
MDALSRKTNKKTRKSFTAANLAVPTPSNRQLPLPNCTNMDDCCKQALEHVYEVPSSILVYLTLIQGLECAQMYERCARPPTAEDEEAETTAMANSRLRDPAEAIPMHYLPLNEQQPPALLPWAVRYCRGKSCFETQIFFLRYRILSDFS